MPLSKQIPTGHTICRWEHNTQILRQLRLFRMTVKKLQIVILSETKDLGFHPAPLRQSLS